MITDASGNTVKEYDYYAFGGIRNESGSFSNTHKFTGKELDESGLYYFGARYMDNAIGRFITPDPSGKFEKGDPQTLNPYVYCTNNPFFYKDPNGEWRTRSEYGNFYVYTPTVSGAAAQELVSFVPVVGLALLGIRKAQGDITISGLDWGCATASSVLWGVGKVFSEGGKGVRIGLGVANAALTAQATYSSLSEVQKAVLDRYILEIYGRKYQGSLKGAKINMGKKGSKKITGKMMEINKITKFITEIIVQGRDWEDVKGKYPEYYYNYYLDIMVEGSSIPW